MFRQDVRPSGRRFAVPCAHLPVAAFASPANPQHSSPAEKAATNDLNEGINDANQAADEHYRAQQETYQNELQRYRGRQQNYQAKADRYEAARDRYIARHAYHRAVWPSRYASWEISGTGGLMGARVHTAEGRLGYVAEIALTPSGRIDALRVSLNRGGDAWIEIRRSALQFREPCGHDQSERPVTCGRCPRDSY